MTAVSVTADNARWDNMDANTNAANWNSTGGTPPAEPDFVYQGTNSVSKKYGGTTLGGLRTSTGANRDLTAAGRQTWMAKVIVTNSSAINSNGMVVDVGSSTSDYYQYNIADDGTTVGPYPAKESWLILPVNPNVAVHRSGTTGSPSLTAVALFGVQAAFSSTSKAENIAMDAVDAGTGLYLVGGDGADADGTFQDYVDTDEGDVTNGRWGYVHTKNGILYCFGTLAIGRSGTAPSTVSPTVFNDSNKTLVFPDGWFDTRFSDLALDVSHETTTITMDGCTFIGRGLDYGSGVDTRPVLTMSGASGSATLTNCSFSNFYDFDLTDSGSFTSCTFNDCVAMSLSSGTQLTGCAFNGHDTPSSGVFITTPTLEKIIQCDFDNTGGTGHALEITATGTYELNACTFTGYGASGTGDAALYNNTGGPVIINVTNNGGSPTYRNGASATTTVNNTVSFTLTNLVANSEVRLYPISGTDELDGVENSGTTFTYNYNYVEDTDIRVVVHSLAYEYLEFDVTLTSTNASVPVQQRTDRNYLNP